MVMNETETNDIDSQLDNEEEFTDILSEEIDESDLEFKRRQKEKQQALLFDEGKLHETIDELNDEVSKTKAINDYITALLVNDDTVEELKGHPNLDNILQAQAELNKKHSTVLNGVINVLSVMNERRVMKEKAQEETHLSNEIPIENPFMKSGDNVIDKVNLLHSQLENALPFVNSTFNLNNQFHRIDEALDNLFIALGITAGTIEGVESDSYLEQVINSAFANPRVKQAISNHLNGSNINNSVKTTEDNNVAKLSTIKDDDDSNKNKNSDSNSTNSDDSKNDSNSSNDDGNSETSVTKDNSSKDETGKTEDKTTNEDSNQQSEGTDLNDVPDIDVAAIQEDYTNGDVDPINDVDDSNFEKLF